METLNRRLSPAVVKPKAAKVATTSVMPANISVISAGRSARGKRNRLVEDHLPLVPPIARRIRRALPTSFDLQDLVSSGLLGLIEAAIRYDPVSHRGVPFSAFARQRIRGAILDSVRRSKSVECVRQPIEEVPEPGFEPDVDAALDRAQLRRRVNAAFAMLSDKHKTVLAAYYRDELPGQRQVAAELGVSATEAGARLREALAALRREVFRLDRSPRAA
jgi:RNA polymerase sigma factor for flagellar operon FliA